MLKTRKIFTATASRDVTLDLAITNRDKTFRGFFFRIYPINCTLIVITMSSKPLRVTFLATLPPNSSTIVGRTIPLAKEVQKYGHSVSLITLGKTIDNVESIGIPTTIVGPSFRDGVNKPNPVKLVSRYFTATTGLRRAIESNKTDVIVLVKPHPQNYNAIKNLSIPFILDSDDVESHTSRSNFLERAWLNRIDKNATRKSNLVTACSPYLVEHYKKMCPGKTVELIPTGIPKEGMADKINLRRYFDIADDAQILLYLGSLAISSGHRVDQIFNIWNEISTSNLKLHLILAGDGIDADKIHAQSKLLSNNNRIHFFGRFDSGSSENFARQATLLIDPIDDSVGNQAKSSSRAMLALKTGTPIISGNVGIRKFLLPDTIHNWALYDTNKPTALVEAVKYGLSEDAHTVFARETQGLWQQWTWEVIGAKFNSLIEEAIK